MIPFMPFASQDVEGDVVATSETITIEYYGSAGEVSILGEWDWDNETELIEVDGVWTAELDLDEGLYCYKFIVDGTYLFDPSNSERSYCGGIENSLLRVKDHERPQFSVELLNDTLLINFLPGSQGGLPDGTPSAISGADWDSVLLQWNYDLSHLTDGKHTIHLECSDVNGNQAYDLLVPFWIGEGSSFEWNDALIYMVMTDRFVNGNTSNDGTTTFAASGADWQGGDFAGVTNMIESGYFSDLGVNALWLSPFNTAATGTGKASDGVHDVSAFHGYWPIEARGIEPRLGTDTELQHLVEVAHESGIRVMMDFVVNHVHEDHNYVQDHPEWFNAGCQCGTANCDWTEHRLDCQFTSYMPDVNWKDRNASEQFISDALWWIETFDLDGARVDAVKHVEDLATRNLVAQINQRFETVGTDYYLKGETAMGWAGHSLEANQEQYGAINAYMGAEGLDGQADFVLYHAVVDSVFVQGSEDYQHLDYWTNRSQDQYTPGSVMVPYVGSHDVPRLASRADAGTSDAYHQWSEDGLPGQPGDSDAYNVSLQAYGWLLTTPGAPLLYYGDEYGEYGGADPDNRHMYRNSSTWSTLENNLFETIQDIGQLRSESVALRRGVYSTVHAEADRLVYAMTHDDQTMNVILNRGAEWDWNGFGQHDVVRFGESVYENSILRIPANSVTIIEVNSSLNETVNETEPIQGCLDSVALNYDPLATVDDNSCEYEADSNGNQSNNTDTNSSIPGCLDETALNYNPNATSSDSSCEFESETNSSTTEIPGCLDVDALNHNPEATIDDDSCDFEPITPSDDVSSASDSNTLFEYIRIVLILFVIGAIVIYVRIGKSNS